MRQTHFKCHGCGEIFEKDPEWTEEDAVVEMENVFGNTLKSQRVIVCDDCYDKFMSLFN